MALQEETSAWSPWEAERSDDPSVWEVVAAEGERLCARWRGYLNGEDASTTRLEPTVLELTELVGITIRLSSRELGRVRRSGEKWQILEACQGIRRRLLSASTAYRRELRRLGVKDGLDEAFVLELQRSLLCRRALARFWVRVEKTRELPILDRVRLGGGAIAVLRGTDGYPSLRPSDRLALLELQQRAIRWLRDPEWRSGAALVQDLEGLVVLTRQMNRRVELREHDAFFVRRGLALLGGTTGEASSGRAAVENLVGLEPMLDHALRGDRLSVGVARRILERVGEGFRAIPRGEAARAEELWGANGGGALPLGAADEGVGTLPSF